MDRLIIGDEESTRKFLVKFTQDQLAEIWCILNSWKTPRLLETKRELEKEEIQMVFNVVRKLVPKKLVLEKWNNDETWRGRSL